jgi:hypothetical protein
MKLECYEMTGYHYKCPNISICHENSSEHSMVKIIYYVLNQQICGLDNIQVGDKFLSDLLQETNQDLDALLPNIYGLTINRQNQVE